MLCVLLPKLRGEGSVWLLLQDLKRQNNVYGKEILLIAFETNEMKPTEDKNLTY